MTTPRPERPVNHRHWLAACLTSTMLILAIGVFEAVFNSDGRINFSVLPGILAVSSGIGLVAGVVGMCIAGLSMRTFYAIYSGFVFVLSIILIVIIVSSRQPVRIPKLSPAPPKSTHRPGGFKRPSLPPGGFPPKPAPVDSPAGST